MSKYHELLGMVVEGAFSKAEINRWSNTYDKLEDIRKSQANEREKYRSGEQNWADTKRNFNNLAKDYSRLNTKQVGEDAALYGRGKRYASMWHHLQRKIDDLQALKKNGTITKEEEKELSSALDKMKAAKDKWMKEHSGKTVKESVDDVKLEIYESCHTGEITEEERDILLSLI